MKTYSYRNLKMRSFLLHIVIFIFRATLVHRSLFVKKKTREKNSGLWFITNSRAQRMHEWTYVPRKKAIVLSPKYAASLYMNRLPSAPGRPEPPPRSSSSSQPSTYHFSFTPRFCVGKASVGHRRFFSPPILSKDRNEVGREKSAYVGPFGAIELSVFCSL